MPASAHSKRYDGQIAAYHFLQERARNREPFTAAELGAATGWQRQSPGTYISKTLRDYLDKIP